MDVSRVWAQNAASVISASAVIDQDTLNVLSFGQSQVGVETVDEIRLGDTFADID